MPYYKCVFVNESGNFSDKIIFSENKNDLKSSFQNGDKKLVKVKRFYFKNFSTFRLFSRKIKYSEFLLFNQKMVVLLKSGASFINALGVILTNMKKSDFKEILLKVESDIQNGIQISDAFSSTKIPFYKIYRASMLAGEKSGALESIIEKFNIYLWKINNIKSKTISSLSYPVCLFIFMILIVFVIMVFVIPKFSSFFESFEAELPTITVIFVSISNWLKGNILSLFFIFFIIYASLRLVEKFNQKVIIFDYLKLKIPFVGKIICENSMAVFSRTLSILISGGIPVPESVEIAIESFSNEYLFSKVKDVPEKIKEGNLLSDALSDIDVIPGLMTEIIRVGESSGNLKDVLDKNADFFESMIDTKINSLVSIIEPIIIIVLGLVVGFMLISIYLPIFQSVKVVR